MRRIIVLLGIMVLGVQWAEAQDGAIEINQLCVASGCFAGDAAGFPVEITQPGSYRLTSNLEVPNATDGVEVLADNVTLDLNGHVIQGPVSCSGSPPNCGSPAIGRGIQLFSANNVKLLNGSVEGFGGECVLKSSGGTFIIRNVHVSQCASSGFDLISQGLLDSSGARDSVGRGAWLSGAILVRDSVFINNGNYGVDLGNCAGNVFRDNGAATMVSEENCTTQIEPNICAGGVCP